MAPPIIEDLGDDTSYYQFNIEKTIRETEEGQQGAENYDYDEVTIQNPVTYNKIIEELYSKGFDVEALKAKVKQDLILLNISVDE
mgnify:CR=1 FL=1